MQACKLKAANTLPIIHKNAWEARATYISWLLILVFWLLTVHFYCPQAYRAKEVDVCKVLSVTPYALRRQFLFESFIIALVAGIAAVLFAKLALPVVSQPSGKAFVDEQKPADLGGRF